MVAVKVATSQKARRRTRKEGELLESLRHPGVLKHFATIESDDAVFIVTEYLAGGDVLHFMKARSCRPLPEPLARNFFLQLVGAVDYLHKAGIVHRDIKCENILLSADYKEIRLADFGFACPWRADKLLYESLGSLHYASPEMCANIPYRGPEADIWSMGVVLYAMLVGRLPFGGKTELELSMRIKDGTFHTPSTLPQVPAALLRWLLHTDASKRITMEQVKSHAWLTAPLNQLEMPRSSSEPLPKASIAIAPSLPMSGLVPQSARRPSAVPASASSNVSPVTSPVRPTPIPHTEPVPVPRSNNGGSRITRLPASPPVAVNARRPSAGTIATEPNTTADIESGGSSLLHRLSRFLGVNGTRKFSFSRILNKDKDREGAQPGTSPE